MALVSKMPYPISERLKLVSWPRPNDAAAASLTGVIWRSDDGGYVDLNFIEKDTHWYVRGFTSEGNQYAGQEYRNSELAWRHAAICAAGTNATMVEFGGVKFSDASSGGPKFNVVPDAADAIVAKAAAPTFGAGPLFSNPGPVSIAEPSTTTPKRVIRRRPTKA